MKKIVNFVFFIVFAFILTACGGGGSAPTTDDPTTVTLNGIAVDNYISGATVCIDTNKDNMCNNGEAQTTTASNGTFSFSNVIPTDDMVIIAYGGTDAITGENFDYIIKNIATNKDSNNKVILSSINALITEYKLETNSTLALAKTKVSTFLGVDTTKAIQDVIANKTSNQTEFLRSLKVFQMVAQINTDNNYTESAKSFKAIAKAIGNDANLRHDQNMSIDSKTINSSTSYTPVLLSKKEFFYYPDLSPANQFAIEAYDPNSRNLTYTMLTSKDYDDFNISGANLLFKTPKTTITNPTDDNADGVYKVDVNISNGTTWVVKTFTVNVKNYSRTVVPQLSARTLSAEDNATDGTIIGSITPVSTGTNDSIIKYELNATTYFDINSSTGNIYVKASLPDVNSSDSQQIPLMLRALNSAGWSSYVDINISIYNGGELNTTATVVGQTFETIYENNNSSQTIGTVQIGITGGYPVTDFNITSGNSDGYFQINSSGVLSSIAHSFDYETVNLYTLGVSAFNNNGWGSPSNIIVKIKDVNDKPIYSTSSVFDRNVSVDTNLSVTISGIADGDTAVQNISTPSVISSNTSAVTINNITFNQTTGNLSFNLEGKDSGESNITVALTDDGGTLNGGVDTTSIPPFKAIVRLNGMKYYERQKASNYTNNSITFDGINYTWNSTKQWYETTNTILMPVIIVSNARSAYLAGNFKEIAEGHYYVNKSEYIWDVNKSQTHTASIQYRNATNSADINVTAKNNNFQHDAYHNFFVSMVTVNSNGEVQSRKYNEWTHTSSNFVDANDSNMSYASAISYSPNYIHTTDTYDVKYADSNNTNNATSSECSNMYGKGWRIPTAYEMGLRTNTYNDVKNGSNSNYNYVPAYVGSEEISIASSSAYKDSNNDYFIAYLKAVKYIAQDGLWGNGEINTQELHVRCIYQP